jgi:hypothetical protein
VVDTDLFRTFIRIKRRAEGVRIAVRTIRWRGPHSPTQKWVLGAALPADTSDVASTQAAWGLLDDPRFFGRCIECGRRRPVGWMHGPHPARDAPSRVTESSIDETLQRP